MLSDLQSELESFVAEVSSELASIRAALSTSRETHKAYVTNSVRWNHRETLSVRHPPGQDRSTMPAEVPAPVGETLSGHDRIAALKVRLAAKLRTEIDPSPFDNNSADDSTRTAQEALES